MVEYEENDETLVFDPKNNRLTVPLEKRCLENLKKIVDATRAQIIVSSSWRDFDGMMEFLEYALGLYEITISGKTSKALYNSRGGEVSKYIKDNNGSKYVILDDQHSESFAECNLGNFV